MKGAQPSRGVRCLRRTGLASIAAAFALALALLSFPPASHASLAAAQAAGETLDLGDGALAYVPATAASPAPVLIVLHGARSAPANIIALLRAQADAKGVILLAPRSQGPTWDLLLSIAAAMRADASAPQVQRPAVDLPRIDAALARLAARVGIDRGRIGLAGFSDGASYALSMGLGRDRGYSAVLAFSPGVMALPQDLPPNQRVFIAYGRQDPGFAEGSRFFAADLRGRSQNVEEFAFDGGHILPQAAAARGVAFFLGAGQGP